MEVQRKGSLHAAGWIAGHPFPFYLSKLDRGVVLLFGPSFLVTGVHITFNFFLNE